MPLGDLVRHDPQRRLQLVVPHRQLVQAEDRVVAGHVRVVHGRTIDRAASLDRVFPDGQVVADREGLGVADHHPDDGPAGGDPGVHVRPNPGLGQKDLVAGTADGRVRVPRKTALVRAPAEFGGRRAFLVEALDRPRVHELVDGLGPVGDLRVPFGDVNDLGAGRLAEPRERPVGLALRGGDQLLERHPVHAGRRGQAAFEHRRGDFEQRPLGEVADEAGVGAVVDDGGRGWACRRELSRSFSSRIRICRE